MYGVKTRGGQERGGGVLGKEKVKGQEEGEGVWSQERKREEVYGVKTRRGEEGEGGE